MKQGNWKCNVPSAKGGGIECILDASIGDDTKILYLVLLLFPESSATIIFLS